MGGPTDEKLCIVEPRLGKKGCRSDPLLHLESFSVVSLGTLEVLLSEREAPEKTRHGPLAAKPWAGRHVLLRVGRKQLVKFRHLRQSPEGSGELRGFGDRNGPICL